MEMQFHSSPKAAGCAVVFTLLDVHVLQDECINHIALVVLCDFLEFRPHLFQQLSSEFQRTVVQAFLFHGHRLPLYNAQAAIFGLGLLAEAAPEHVSPLARGVYGFLCNFVSLRFHTHAFCLHRPCSRYILLFNVPSSPPRKHLAASMYSSLDRNFCVAAKCHQSSRRGSTECRHKRFLFHILSLERFVFGVSSLATKKSIFLTQQD